MCHCGWAAGVEYWCKNHILVFQMRYTWITIKWWKALRWRGWGWRTWLNSTLRQPRRYSRHPVFAVKHVLRVFYIFIRVPADGAAVSSHRAGHGEGPPGVRRQRWEGCDWGADHLPVGENAAPPPGQRGDHGAGYRCRGILLDRSSHRRLM